MPDMMCRCAHLTVRSVFSDWHCWFSWNPHHFMLVLAGLDFFTVMEKGQLGYFYVSSFKFLTKRSLKPW